jgi:hypothetical protein
MVLTQVDEDDLFNVGFDLDEAVKNLPMGLDREVRRILDFHIGRENSIGGTDFVRQLAEYHGIHCDNRQLRLSIQKWRFSGLWVCSTGGIKGGYWLAANQEELDEFCLKELDSRIDSLRDQKTRMRQAAEKQWGRYSPEKQISLF